MKNDENEMKECNSLTQFALVIAVINFEHLSSLVISLRKRIALIKLKELTCTNEEDLFLSCTILFPSLADSYNILYSLLFSDEVC